MKRKIIALTGGIGSGKSTVGQILREQNFSVVDCDELAREVAKNPDILEKVQQLLGKESVVDGKLNRSYVRSRVFSDNLLHEKYSAIFWQEIRRLLCARTENLPLVFVEIPVLDAFSFPWTEIWLVESAEKLRVGRVALRDGVGEQDVFNIISKQSVCQNYTKKLNNDGNLQQLRRSVLQAVADIMQQ